MRYEEAEKDCTRAVLLDSSYSKAYARRGTARAALGKFKEAIQGEVFNNGGFTAKMTIQCPLNTTVKVAQHHLNTTIKKSASVI